MPSSKPSKRKSRRTALDIKPRHSPPKRSPSSSNLSVAKSAKGRRPKRFTMVTLIEAELTVTDNHTSGYALMVNAPTGTGDYVLPKKITISKNRAEGESTQLNCPHDLQTLELVASVRGQKPDDIVSHQNEDTSKMDIDMDEAE